MDADEAHDDLASPEALREVIFTQRRELDARRDEARHANLLIDALDSLLDVSSETDPFTGVFAVLQPVFAFSHALVLAEDDTVGSPLRCIVSSVATLVGTACEPSPLLEKVLRGRITATLGNQPHPGWPVELDGAGLPAAHPALYLPVGFRDRRGLMVLVRPAGAEGFDRTDVDLARKFTLLASHAFAARVANGSERERRRLRDLTEELRAAQAMLSHRAYHDELTGLPNRALLEEHVVALLEAADASHRVALAFIDLDGFKQVNDVYGHDVGDGLLVEVAQRVRGQIRSTDVLARISGDEFVLLLDPIDTVGLELMVERVLNGLKQSFVVQGVHLVVSASIGVAIFPDHGSTYEALRRNADLAMYSAKSHTRGTAALFDPALGRAADRRASFERELRQAVGDGRFRAVFQPKVDLATMAVTGFEALARRVDDDGRLHTPAEFIAAAGQLGLLDAITEILLDDVTAAMAGLDAVFGNATTVSVNVSARQATTPRTMRALLARLRQPERFIVEVTEDALLHAGIFRRDIVPLFDELGVRMSIDDFGTGYATLTTLLEVPAHELKVDRSFVAGIDDRPRAQVILQMLAAASRALGVQVVVEGVETAEELGYLTAANMFDAAQGYLFSRPELPEVLVDQHALLVARLGRLRFEHPANGSRQLAS